MPKNFKSTNLNGCNLKPITAVKFSDITGNVLLEHSPTSVSAQIGPLLSRLYIAGVLGRLKK